MSITERIVYIYSCKAIKLSEKTRLSSRVPLGANETMFLSNQNYL